MLLRVGVIASALNPGLGAPLAAPLGAAAAVLGLAALGFVFGAQRGATDPARPTLAISNPLVVCTSLKLAGFIIVVTLAVEAVKRFWGDAGVLAVSGLSGLADVDAITLSIARMDMAVTLAGRAVLLAVAVNTLSKACLAAWFGGRDLGLRVGAASAAAILAAGGVHVGLGGSGW